MICSSKVILLIFKLGFSSTWTENFQMYKLVLEKAEKPEIKLPTSVGSQRKHENSRKISASASLTTQKPLTVWITANCGKFLKRWDYQTTLPVSWNLYVDQKQQLEPCMEQLVQNWERSTTRLYVSPYLFNFYAIMWNTALDDSQAGIKIARKNTSNFRCVDNTTLMAESEEELKKSLLMRVKEDSEKAGWKFSVKK